MRNLETKTKEILTNYPYTRESEPDFIRQYFSQSGNNALFIDLSNENLKLIASLQRRWRLVQMKHKELRGSNWITRQKLSKEVKEHYIKTGEIIK